jgi:enamine deaminase RidA (YjgF/YER057c/UK114 family)
MARIEQRLTELGFTLPAQMALPAGVTLPFPFVQIQGTRVLISGHGPLDPDGEIAGPLGKLGAELTVEQGYSAARLTGLAILSSLKSVLGDLDRIKSWTRIFGMVNSAPGFIAQPAVINGFSDLIIALYGVERGAHTRSAVGMAELPFNIPVEIEGEAEMFA